MIQKVFGIRDSKSQAFLQPFFSVAVGSAVRAFIDAVNDNNPNNQIAKHPEDYILYEIADFDDNTGKFVSCIPIKMLGVGKDFVNPVRNGFVPGAETLKEVFSNGEEKK